VFFGNSFGTPTGLARVAEPGEVETRILITPIRSAAVNGDDCGGFVVATVIDVGVRIRANVGVRLAPGW
jgi:hypothetical protein